MDALYLFADWNARRNTNVWRTLQYFLSFFGGAALDALWMHTVPKSIPNEDSSEYAQRVKSLSVISPRWATDKVMFHAFTSLLSRYNMTSLCKRTMKPSCTSRSPFQNANAEEN